MGWPKRFYFWAALAALTAVFLLLAWPYVGICGVYALARKKTLAPYVRTGIWQYGRTFIHPLRPVAPIKVHGLENVAPAGPCILTPNHQSFLDIYLIASQKRKNICFVLTDWPFTRLFFFSRLMSLAGYIKVGKETDYFDFMESCREALDNGAVLVCFPEGSRSRSGALLPFRSGIFRVAVQSGCPVTPLVYLNSGKVCSPGSFRVIPQPIHVRYLTPLKPKIELGFRPAITELQERTRLSMQEVLEHFHPETETR